MYFKNFEKQVPERDQEKKEWAAEEKLLLKTLRDAVDLAYQKKKLSDRQAAEYFKSSRCSS